MEYGIYGYRRSISRHYRVFNIEKNAPVSPPTELRQLRRPLPNTSNSFDTIPPLEETIPPTITHDAMKHNAPSMPRCHHALHATAYSRRHGIVAAHGRR